MAVPNRVVSVFSSVMDWKYIVLLLFDGTKCRATRLERDTINIDQHEMGPKNLNERSVIEL